LYATIITNWEFLVNYYQSITLDFRDSICNALLG
jgi:hypothetical protein